MMDGSFPEETIEGFLLTRKMGFEVLGFTKDFFNVSKGNNRVIRFHQLTGAKIVAENDIDYFFEITRETYNQHKELFEDVL